MAEAKKLLAESGYDGTPVVVMAPGDVVTLKAQPIVARATAARGRLQGRPAGDRLADRGDPPRQPEAAEGRRLEHVLHQLGQRRRLQPDRQPLGRRPGQEWRLVRLGGRRQDRAAASDAFARASSLDEQKKIAADIQKQTYEQVIYIPLGQYLDTERLAQIDLRRARRPGHADLLERRKVG